MDHLLTKIMYLICKWKQGIQ